MVKFNKTKTKKKLKEVGIGLKKDFIAFNKTPSIGEKIGNGRKKIFGKLKKSKKLKKVRVFSASRGREIGKSLRQPSDLNIF